jgi:ATP-dependent Clp protease ATP-binding subunit ClpC
MDGIGGEGAEMKLVIPAYVERRMEDSGPRYWATPVFWEPEKAEDGEEGSLVSAEDALEDKAVLALEKNLTEFARKWAMELDHADLVRLSFSPVCQSHRLSLRLELRRKSLSGDFLAVSYESSGRRLVVVPKLRGVCFEWKPGRDLRETALLVLQAHFRKLEKEADDDGLDVEELVAAKEAHLTLITISVEAAQRRTRESDRRLSLGDDAPPDGQVELEKTGRRFEKNDATPEVLLRDGVIAEIGGRLPAAEAARAMIVLVGPAGSGKTAVLREAVAQWRQRRPSHLQGGAWLVSPQRVISGMMVQGQWEARWLAILTHLAKRRHLLVLDDLTGLFHAGRSSGSDLSLGHVLKAQQERNAVSVVAETTPEAWARLREMDRGFADLFHVIHLREPDDEACLRILVRTMQRLETDSPVRFAPEVLPLILTLQRRYARSRAFPGKAVDLLRALAVAGSEEAVDRDFTLKWFCARTGFSLRFLNHAQPLERAVVSGFLTERIAGQEGAVKAMTDVVMLTRAQLNDPDRPLGTLLFTGPTGVGKTECAKALAAFVFGSAERMLRFDMNEYNGSDAADRLIGGFGRPGQLTAAVRRQPCGVLLLDEIEKAHADVFDLLLQVLGEGRLTDAAGQTADFCNCIIILTSNLGSSAKRQVTGFQAVAMDDRQIYREAAEKFFRPEFFNRLDQVVPFTLLSPGDIARLAGVLARKALDRPGLRARQLRVVVDDQTIAWLGERGFDAKYGARALRRAVEEHLVEPLAAYLAVSELADAGAAEAQVKIGGDGKIEVMVSVLEQAPPWITVPGSLSAMEIGELLRSVRERLVVLEERLEEDDFRDEQVELDAGVDGDELSDLDAWYYSLRDEVAVVREQERRLRDRLDLDEEWRKRRSASRAAKTQTEAVDPHWRVLPPEMLAGCLNRLRQSGPTARAVSEVFQKALPVTALTGDALRLRWRLDRLEALTNPAFAKPTGLALRVAEALPARGLAAFLGHSGLEAWPFLGVSHGDDSNVVLVQGHGVREWGHLLSGVIARVEAGGGALLTRMVNVDGPEGESPMPNEVLRVLTPQGLIDFRTGLVRVGGADTAGDLLWALTKTGPPIPNL